jgi:glutathione S-transferase
MPRILYHVPRSPYARKVRILLAEKNLNYEEKIIDLANKPAEFMQISPLGKVPVFVDEDQTVIWDSSLIVEYLEETYPEPSFYPSDKRQKLECKKWEEIADNLADNSIALWSEKSQGDKAEIKVINRYQTAIDRILTALETQLQQTYLLGEKLTIADLAAIASLGYYSLRHGETWQKLYPRLNNFYDLLHQIDAIKSTRPQG